MQYNFNFLQTGGVPLTNDLMSLIEKAYGIFEVLGDVSGNLTILSGCELVGSNVSPGIVAIEGKLYYFEGGNLFNKVYIHKEEISKVFQDNTSKILITKRTVKFGNAATSYDWNEFVRLDSLKVLKNKIDQAVNRLDLLELKTAPIINGGIVIAWRKPVDEIPLGWKECLDFRGKTIVGWNPNESEFANLNSNIGSKTHTLTISEMPSHNHQIFGQDNSANPIGATSNEVANVENAGPFNRYSSSVGGGQPHNNIQPSRIALFIEPNFQ